MSGFDITDTLAPASDQLDAIELVSGPRIFTIERVSKGSAEQPLNVHLVDFPRPWRPSKGMRRVLAFCWGADAAKWVGRRAELFFDPEVAFGKDKPGGTRIARLSHIDKRKQVPLLVSRGKSKLYTVEPLPDNATGTDIGPTLDDVAACTDVNQLRDWWPHEHLQSAITARVAELKPAEPAVEPESQEQAASDPWQLPGGEA